MSITALTPLRSWVAALAAGLPLLAAAQATQTESAAAEVARLAPGEVPFSESIARRLSVPSGFEVSVFASGLGSPRMMEIGPDGTVYVTRRQENDVLALRDNDGDGRADERRVFAQLKGVHGIALHDGLLYLASSTTVWRTPLDVVAPQVLVSGLPEGGQHPNRTLRFGPDGGMYVSIGSSCNDCAEENQLERGTMVRYTPDGRLRSFVSKGLRNTIGFDWHPATGALWGMDHGNDFRGDTIPPEELNEIKAGANYGWPICYGARVVDAMTNATPERLAFAPGKETPDGVAVPRADYCARTEPARLLADAHAAPMDLRFYRGGSFPAEYRGDAFVALRGSWNRGDPVGFKVARIRFDARGQPLRIDDFLTGFLDGSERRHFGRPVGLAFAADGAMLLSDDANGAIYRIAPRRATTPPPRR